MATELSTRIDPTQLHMVSRDRVAGAVHALLHGAHSDKGEVILAASAVLFVVMAERYGLNAEDLYHLGRKVLYADEPHHDKANVQLEALRDFATLRVRQNALI